jgi:hypothetical protein
MVTRHALVVTSVVGLIAAAGVGVATASIPDSNGVITACVKGKQVYVVDTDQGRRCRKGQQTVRWNAAGAAGARGEKGEQGAPGIAGPPAPPSRGFVAVDSSNLDIPTDEAGVAVLSKTLPAGKYVISASVGVGVYSGGIGTVQCDLVGPAGIYARGGQALQSGFEGSVSLDTAAVVTGDETFTIRCRALDFPGSARWRTLTATEVDSIQ